MDMAMLFYKLISDLSPRVLLELITADIKSTARTAIVLFTVYRRVCAMICSQKSNRCKLA